MKLECLGAAYEVTGSRHYLRMGKVNLLVDCGREQGENIYVNQEIPVNAAKIDYVLVTHAHVDHSGLLPLLYSKGFRGKIYASRETAEWYNDMSMYMYGMELEYAERVLKCFVPCEYGKKVTLCPEITIRFIDADRSSSIEVWGTEEGKQVKLVFSGDIGNGNRSLIRDPEYIKEADYLGTDEDIIYWDVEAEVEKKQRAMGKNVLPTAVGENLLRHAVGKNLLHHAVEKLSNLERRIVELRFGLNPSGEEMTQKEVADFFGISQSYVSRLEKKVRKRLQRAAEKLSDREQMIVELRFGLKNPSGEEITQKELADLLGISQSSISRLEENIIKRLEKEIVGFK